MAIELDGDGGIDGSEEEPMHPALLTMHQLEAESPGSLDPELVASICGWDRDLILRFIREESGQEIAWREARDDALQRADAEEASVCAIEMRHGEYTTELLRRALRVLVERRAARDTEARPGEDREEGSGYA